MDVRPGVAGSLGPRLAGRLTAELVLRSPQYMNCVKEYEIDLRGQACCSDTAPTLIRASTTTCWALAQFDIPRQGTK